MADKKANDDLNVERIGNYLEGKKIALLVTGGIAAYKIPSLARHFRQYGADVHVYTTPEAGNFVTPMSLEWASANSVVQELTSSAEHLDNFDAYVIAPATYSTIGKMANGIADNAVTSTLATAFGRSKKGKAVILIAPTMHGDMYDSPFFTYNIGKLASEGVKIISPEYRLCKANLPSAHSIVMQTIREMSRSPIKGRHILVTAGPTPGRIDDVRLITNKFRGNMGIGIADEAYMRGANVKLILGAGSVDPPKYIDTIVIKDFDGYLSAVMGSLKERHFDAGIFSAAVADYIPIETKEGKIPSQGALRSIPLKETPKVIKEARRNFPDLFMVTFKYEVGVSRQSLEDIAIGRVAQGYDIVVANRGEDMVDGYKGIIVDKTGVAAEPSSKSDVARILMDMMEKRGAE